VISKLTQTLLLEGVKELSSCDKKLGKVVERFGPPPMWGRRPGYGALVKIILEQQVSLTSAQAIFKRLQSSVPKVSAEDVHDLSINGLRELGFTRQKSKYCIGLAEAILNGNLVLADLNKMDDDEAHNALLTIKGIGPWTATSGPMVIWHWLNLHVA
jgi:DNA-3-methyladenine glycosylase II